MLKGYVYILECNDGSYYTGSTVNLELRIQQHQNGLGANHTKKRLPIKLVYFEEFQRIDEAFYREKQIQGWSRKKKEALIEKHFEKLPDLSLAYRDKVSSRASDTTSRASDTTRIDKTAKMKRFYSNGKLLLTGEYVVLDGAVSLAIPTKYGQSLEVEPINESNLIWKSYDEKGTVWFEDEFLIDEITTSLAPRNDIKIRLIQILNAAKKLNPEFLNSNLGYKITTILDFPRNWGLGTSSTLINNIAQWANIDAYRLLENTFGGSGYDIACAQNNTPINYQLQKGKPIVKSVNFNPWFKDHLYFVHLNKKQNSREGITYYNNHKSDLNSVISDINNITLKMGGCNNLSDFETLLALHETIIGNATKQKPIKERLFNDFNGSIKSLGAWGGDFILVASKDNPSFYFKNKGFETIIPYSNMIL